MRLHAARSNGVHEAIKLARRDQQDLSLDVERERGDETELASPTPGPPEQAELREKLGLVRTLRPRQQRYLLLLAAGYSWEEIISREPGLIRRTLERQIMHGRDRLRVAA